MLAKRIIPCLDVRNGKTVKGIQFVNIQEIGNPVEQAIAYAEAGADEIVFLDITASHESRRIRFDWVEDVAKGIHIPFTVGGGVDSLENARILLTKGADKIAVNSAAIAKPELIKELADHFGSQCIVLAVDAHLNEGLWEVYTHGGRKKTNYELFSWVKQAEKLGAGEILFTSMNHDGTKKGFAVDALKRMCNELNIPVIASGGAGSMDDFIDVFQNANVDAALAASIFHYGEIGIQQLKQSLKKANIQVRL